MAISNTTINGAKPAASSGFTIPISDSDRLAGTTSPATVQKGVETYHRDGIVALTNAVDPEIAKALNEKMVADTEEYIKRSDAHWNQGKAARNISQVPPLQKEWIHQQIWANPHAMVILENLLGPQPELHFVNSNIALSNPNPNARQAVHSDAYFDHPHFPWCMVVNIYLSEVNAQRGVTEIWPGTHTSTKADHLAPHHGWIQRHKFVERAKVSPPVQPSLPAGTVVIRDMRIWHAGMPNLTPDPRIMLTFVYFPKYYRNPMKIKLPLSVRSTVNSWPMVDFEAGTEWVDDGIDYLGLQFQANWTQTEAGLVAGGANGVTSGGKEDVEVLEPTVQRENYWVAGDVE
ncbi:phytanoyl-dioxygenase family protein [Seiridium cupressi]